MGVGAPQWRLGQASEQIHVNTRCLANLWKIGFTNCARLTGAYPQALFQVTDAEVDSLVILQQGGELLRVVGAVSVGENDLRLNGLDGVREILWRHHPVHRQKRSVDLL